ncbi:MAG: DEAD/DEAH box helicase family protein, partial [Candidatus Azambacteria bacterium]|nr:DEAD/DEAH box helicase family protein [Candidatus Azambacteria bacterium]
MLENNQNNRKFILDVAPLTKIPLTREQYFWYLADKNLPPGTLVSAPLFKRKMEGIVIGSKSDFKRSGNIKLKNIETIIEENFLNDRQLKLAKFISEYYISPLGVVLKNFIPKRIKSRKNKNDKGISDSSQRPEPTVGKRGEIILTPGQKSAVDKISKSYELKAKSYLLFGSSGSGKTEVYIHSILKLKKQNPEFQFLILVPEKTLTPQAVERYGAYFPSGETAVLSSNIPKGQYYSSWQKIRSNEAKIIIGTRMTVFAPFKKLGLIVIDEEQDISYKQWDMNPRYDARIVAEKLAEIH